MIRYGALTHLASVIGWCPITLGRWLVCRSDFGSGHTPISQLKDYVFQAPKRGLTEILKFVESVVHL